MLDGAPWSARRAAAVAALQRLRSRPAATTAASMPRPALTAQRSPAVAAGPSQQITAVIDAAFAAYTADVNAAIAAYGTTLAASAPVQEASTVLTAPHAPVSGLLTVADGAAFGEPTPQSPIMVTALPGGDPSRAVLFNVTGRVGNTLVGAEAVDPITGSSTFDRSSTAASTLTRAFVPSEAVLSLAGAAPFGTPTADAPLVLVATAPDGTSALLEATGVVGDTLTGILAYDATTGDFVPAATVAVPGLPAGTLITAMVVNASTFDTSLPAGTPVQSTLVTGTQTTAGAASQLTSYYLARSQQLANQLDQSVGALQARIPGRGVRTAYAMNIFYNESLAATTSTSLLGTLDALAVPITIGPALDLYQSSVASAIDAIRLRTIQGTLSLARGVDFVSPRVDYHSGPVVVPSFGITPVPVVVDPTTGEPLPGQAGTVVYPVGGTGTAVAVAAAGSRSGG